LKVLVINCGSSSVKYQLIDTDAEDCLAKGDIARIGMTGAVLTHKPKGREMVKKTGEILDHIMAIEHVISMLLSPTHGAIKKRSDIDAVGHRVVHGGEDFTESTLINDDVMTQLRHLIDLAPLHNPHNILGINACLKTLEDTPQVAVFDTALHHKMPDYAYIYGLPYVFYTKYKIRRYGFHGMSHRFVSVRAAELIGRPYEELKIITAHLGNGASIAAIDCGVSVDTSMGLTPLEGLLMGTRSGDIDPAIILRIMATEELSLHEANTLLNKHSGLMGISGRSSDMREIIESMDDGRMRARLAFDVYCYRIRKYVGAYMAVLNGADAIVFTGGIGENSARVRAAILKDLDWFGIELDQNANDSAVGCDAEISKKDSSVRVFAIPTNEELVIAKDTARIVDEGKAV
jgi:acetate kinase